MGKSKRDTCFIRPKTNVKIDTIKIGVFFNLQRKVAWRVEDGDLSSNPCKTRKLGEEPFN